MKFKSFLLTMLVWINFSTTKSRITTIENGLTIKSIGKDIVKFQDTSFLYKFNPLWGHFIKFGFKRKEEPEIVGISTNRLTKTVTFKGIHCPLSQFLDNPTGCYLVFRFKDIFYIDIEKLSDGSIKLTFQFKEPETKELIEVISIYTGVELEAFVQHYINNQVTYNTCITQNLKSHILGLIKKLKGVMDEINSLKICKSEKQKLSNLSLKMERLQLRNKADEGTNFFELFGNEGIQKDVIDDLLKVVQKKSITIGARNARKPKANSKNSELDTSDKKFLNSIKSASKAILNYIPGVEENEQIVQESLVDYIKFKVYQQKIEEMIRLNHNLEKFLQFRANVLGLLKNINFYCKQADCKIRKEELNSNLLGINLDQFENIKLKEPEKIF
jgi:hypothetical protein